MIFIENMEWSSLVFLLLFLFIMSYQRCAERGDNNQIVKNKPELIVHIVPIE